MAQSEFKYNASAWEAGEQGAKKEVTSLSQAGKQTFLYDLLVNGYDQYEMAVEGGQMQLAALFRVINGVLFHTFPWRTLDVVETGSQ